MKIRVFYSAILIMIALLSINDSVPAQDQKLQKPTDKLPKSLNVVLVRSGQEESVTDLFETKDFSNPGVIMFVSHTDPSEQMSVVRLVKLLDLALQQENAARARGAVVFLDAEHEATVIKMLTGDDVLKKIQVAKYPDQGDPGYKVSRSNPVTLLMWKDKEISTTFELSSDELQKANTGKDVLVKFLTLLN